MTDPQDTGNPSARQVLLDLADRCEREEPSRELDRQLAVAAGYCVEVFNVPPDHPIFKAGGGLEFMYRPGKGGRTAIPPYTTSLDAAVTLVPEGWNWAVEHFTFDAVLPYEQPGAKASVWRDSRNPKERIFNIKAPTPALALCAASLRARAEAL